MNKIARGLTAKQFVEWECYARLEPFNELREDYRTASIVTMIYNMAVDPKHRMKLEDFLLKWGEPMPKPKQDTLAVLKVLAAAYSDDVGPTPKQDVDREVSAEMRAQVAKAHAAMKGLPS